MLVLCMISFHVLCICKVGKNEIKNKNWINASDSSDANRYKKLRLISHFKLMIYCMHILNFNHLANTSISHFKYKYIRGPFIYFFVHPKKHRNGFSLICLSCVLYCWKCHIFIICYLSLCHNLCHFYPLVCYVENHHHVMVII